MRVSDIKQQKRRTNRVSIYVDGKYSFSLDYNTFIRAGIHLGDEIVQKDIDALLLKDEYARALDYGYLLLSYRDRSEYELRRRLLEKGFHVDLVREVLKFFRDKKLLDDRQFAKKWIENSLSSRPMGRMRMKHELKGKMVEDGIIDEVVGELVDDDTEMRLARRLTEKKLEALKSYPVEVRRARLLRFLKSRGFNFDLIQGLMEEYFSDDI
ncbi:MAG: regulatory protein RecX [Spirochaetota bacterium]